MRQGILNFPFFSMQLKTADHKYSNVLEPILNPTEITIPPNDRVLNRTNSLLYPENAVTGILQPNDLLHEGAKAGFPRTASMIIRSMVEKDLLRVCP